MKILFLAMSESIHTARWIRQLEGSGHELHLFPSIESHRLHPALHGQLTFHARISSTASGPRRRGAFLGPPLVAGAAHLVASKAWPDEPAKRLEKLIRKLRPDIVHSLELQAAGYLALAVKETMGTDFPLWMVSNWGSDISLFGRLPEHQRRLRSLLSLCDAYLCECRRDLPLAANLGLPGETPAWVIPMAGGQALGALARWRAKPTSSRRVLLLKGYHNWAGRSMVALRAMELVASKLKGYEISISSASPDVELKARLLQADHGLDVKIVPGVTHESMLRLQGQARISIGLSISDGISTSLLEAMAMGAFPIQSWTACADEWIIDGLTGLLVPPEDPAPVAAALARALEDDSLVDEAARLNAAVIAERLDSTLVSAQTLAIYEAMAKRT